MDKLCFSSNMRIIIKFVHCIPCGGELMHQYNLHPNFYMLGVSYMQFIIIIIPLTGADWTRSWPGSYQPWFLLPTIKMSSIHVPIWTMNKPLDIIRVVGHVSWGCIEAWSTASYTMDPSSIALLESPISKFSILFHNHSTVFKKTAFHWTEDIPTYPDKWHTSTYTPMIKFSQYTPTEYNHISKASY